MEGKVEEKNELVVIESASIPAVFEKDGSNPIIERIKKEVREFSTDPTTKKGRDEIKSLAYKVAQSKTYLDGLGKDLVAEIKARTGIIDAERKKIRDELDTLKEEVRRPVTEFEEAEKKRVADIEERISSINAYLEIEAENSEHASRLVNEIKNIEIDKSFEEFELAATKARAAVLTQLEAKFIVLQNAEKEKAEAERLEKERLEKEQKEREERIAIEAAEKARVAAEEKARKEAEEKERKEKEEKERLEREKLEAQLAQEKAEKEKIEAKRRKRSRQKRGTTKNLLKKLGKPKSVSREKKRRSDSDLIRLQRTSLTGQRLTGQLKKH
jgi:septal ring factor EnvC (AmiA/AmiB activator)